MNFLKPFCAALLIAILHACDSGTEPLTSGSNRDNIWLIPTGEVRDGGPGKDGIPALLNPKTVLPSEASYLSDDDLVIGYANKGEAKAYPHKILDWHEIINDRVGSTEIAITYCPLTGTGVGWSREHNRSITTFGVSGLLYNTNLIPYDRATNSNWTQIGLTCVNGERAGEEIGTFPVVETTWGVWKKMFPNTEVVSDDTGYSRNYENYPYGHYREEDGLLFSVAINDTRLPQKERVHAIIIEDMVKIYQLPYFIPNPIYIDEIDGNQIVIAGNAAQKFAVSFENKQIDGEWLEFFVPSGYTTAEGYKFPVLMVDQFGNGYNVFGEVIAGPNMGESLTPTKSFMGYSFSFASFYPVPEIYEP